MEGFASIGGPCNKEWPSIVDNFVCCISTEGWGECSQAQESFGRPNHLKPLRLCGTIEMGSDDHGVIWARRWWHIPDEFFHVSEGSNWPGGCLFASGQKVLQLAIDWAGNVLCAHPSFDCMWLLHSTIHDLNNRTLGSLRHTPLLGRLVGVFAWAHLDVETMLGLKARYLERKLGSNCNWVNLPMGYHFHQFPVLQSANHLHQVVVSRGYTVWLCTCHSACGACKSKCISSLRGMEISISSSTTLTTPL